MGAGWVGSTEGQIDERAWGSYIICTLGMQLKPSQLTESNQK